MLDSLSFPPPTAPQPSPAQRSGTATSAVDQLTNSSSTPTHSAASSTTGVGRTRAALVAREDAHAATSTAVAPKGDTIAPRSPQARPNLHDAAAKFGPNAASAHPGATTHATSGGVTPMEQSDSSKQGSWLNSAGDFTRGLGKGAWDGASGMVQGVGDLAKGGYHLATSADARSHAADTISKGATAAGQFAKTAMTDPAKAASQVGHAAGDAVNNVSTAYHHAEADGHSAEFIGKIVGHGAVLAATLPVGGAEAEGAAAVGDVGRMAEAAGDLGKTGDAAGHASEATDAADAASSKAAAHPTVSAMNTAAQNVSKTDATSKALLRGEKFSEGQPPVDLQHVFLGEVGKKGGVDVAKGFHHAPTDNVHANARVVAGKVSSPNAQGVYEATVKISQPGTNTAYAKNSTMFPDSMSRDDVVKSIQHAYEHATETSGNKFVGPSGYGFDVKGYTSGTGASLHIRTAYPVINK